YLIWFSSIKVVFNPKPNNLDRRFRIYRETLSRFSCAASVRSKSNLWFHTKSPPFSSLTEIV
ncbi:hypothetical protein ACTMNS_13005, partial [Staphylococcus haemolyticus]